MGVQTSRPLPLCGYHIILTIAAMMSRDILQCASLDNP